MLDFNVPLVLGGEIDNIKDAINSRALCGGKKYSKLCESWFNEYLSCDSSLMTPSCTHALELAAILLDIENGDEVIMPSFTFVSTANAFILRGASVKFVDIDPNSMNIDENLIEKAITPNTKAIVIVHYAGVSCEMDLIVDICKKYKIPLIEDAAQAIGSYYKDRPLGGFGDLAAFSFHETKNLTSGGEGGLLAINNAKYTARAEIVREKGTNRSNFIRGVVDKYSWVDLGSSYLPSEIQSAYLYYQLGKLSHITENRMKSWDTYHKYLEKLADLEHVFLPDIPNYKKFNAHIFYIKCRSTDVRDQLIDYMTSKSISCVFHYLPLHSSPMGITCSEFIGKDYHTTEESGKLLRLPMYYGLEESDIAEVIKNIYEFFGEEL